MIKTYKHSLCLLILILSLSLFGIIMFSCSSSINTHSANHSENTPSWLLNYSSQNEFSITNETQLNEFSNFVNGVYKNQGNFENKKVTLDADITLNENCQAGVGGMYGAKEFWPIGDSITKTNQWFAGEFNGNGHSISGLYGTTPSDYGSLGFFAGITGNAYIHDILFKNSYYECFEFNNPAGIIACVNQTEAGKTIKIENIYIDKDVYVSGRNDAGGIIGKATGIKESSISINNCAFMGTARSLYRSTEIDKETNEVSFFASTGGIISNSTNVSTTISDCLSMGNIIGGTNSTGIIGTGDDKISVHNCVDLSSLRSGSLRYGYRLYGGTNNNKVNEQADISNNVYLITEDIGAIYSQTGFSNNLEISNVDEFISGKNATINSKIQKWINRSNLLNKCDISIPSGLKNIAPESSYCINNVSLEQDAKVSTAGDPAIVFSAKYRKDFIDSLLAKTDKNNIKIGIEINGTDYYQTTIDTSKLDSSSLNYVCSFEYKDISKENYNTNYTANAYVESSGEKNYSSNTTQACLKDISWTAISDVNGNKSDKYKYEVGDDYFKHKFSPYTSDIRNKLLSYVDVKPIQDINSEYTSPESVGLSSQEILKMYEDMQSKGLDTHSTMVMRHGKIVTEKYAEGYDKDTLQRMYSVSKSITAISMGLLLQDSNYNVNIDDPVGKYFHEYEGKAESVPFNTTIRQCMNMSTPFNHGVYKVSDPDYPNWIDNWFLTKPDKDPNAYEYYYDTCGTHIVGTIVKRVTGKEFLDYARERGLNKLGITEDNWCVKSPEGNQWGGSGVMFNTHQLLNVGEMLLNGGRFNGEQILNESFVNDSLKSWIDDKEEGYSCQDGRGYGYFIWKTDIGFAFLGMGQQVMIEMPKYDMVFAITSDNQGYSSAYHDVFDIVTRHLCLAAKDGALPENKEANKSLQDYKLKLLVQKGEKSSDIANKINNKTFSGGDSNKISDFKIDFSSGKLTYTCHGEKNKVIDFGLCENKFGNLDETSYNWKTINVPMYKEGRNDGFRAASSGAWIDKNTFALTVLVVDDYLTNLHMTFKFSDDGSTCTMTNKAIAEGFISEYICKNLSFTSK